MGRKRVAAAEARAAMKDLVDAVKDRNERIKITRYGKTVAYLVPAKDGEALENCAEELEECAARTRMADGQGRSQPGKPAGKGNGIKLPAGRTAAVDRMAKTIRAEKSGVAPAGATAPRRNKTPAK